MATESSDALAEIEAASTLHLTEFTASRDPLQRHDGSLSAPTRDTNEDIDYTISHFIGNFPKSPPGPRSRPQSASSAELERSMNRIGAEPDRQDSPAEASEHSLDAFHVPDTGASDEPWNSLLPRARRRKHSALESPERYSNYKLPAGMETNHGAIEVDSDIQSAEYDLKAIHSTIQFRKARQPFRGTTTKIDYTNAKALSNVELMAEAYQHISKPQDELAVDTNLDIQHTPKYRRVGDLAGESSGGQDDGRVNRVRVNREPQQLRTRRD